MTQNTLHCLLGRDGAPLGQLSANEPQTFAFHLPRECAVCSQSVFLPLCPQFPALWGATPQQEPGEEEGAPDMKPEGP